VGGDKDFKFGRYVDRSSSRMANHPWKWRGQVKKIILILVGTNHISRT